MWVKVSKDKTKVERVFNSPVAYTDEHGTQHPKTIFRAWSKEELRVLDILPLVKIAPVWDQRIQTLGTKTYQINAEEVIETTEVIDKALEPLKETEIAKCKSQAYSYLQPTDWYVIRNSEGYLVPEWVAKYRKRIRSCSNERELLISNCSDLHELASVLSNLPEWPTEEEIKQELLDALNALEEPVTEEVV